MPGPFYMMGKSAEAVTMGCAATGSVIDADIPEVWWHSPAFNFQEPASREVFQVTVRFADPHPWRWLLRYPLIACLWSRRHRPRWRSPGPPDRAEMERRMLAPCRAPNVIPWRDAPGEVLVGMFGGPKRRHWAWLLRYALLRRLWNSRHRLRWWAWWRL